MEFRDVRGLTATAYDIVGCAPGRHLGLPSPTVTLVIDLADGLVLGTPNRPGVHTFGCCLAGMHLRPVTIHHDGTQRGVQFALDPRLVRSLFGMPAAELAHHAVELAQVDAPLADELQQRLTAAPPNERESLAAAIVASRRTPADGLFDAHTAWSLLAHRRGQVSVAELVERSGWSARHLTAVFTAEFGIGPKQAARLLRFDMARRRLESGRPAGEVAADCGYTDQPHLSREFSELTGSPPKALLRHRASEFV